MTTSFSRMWLIAGLVLLMGGLAMAVERGGPPGEVQAAWLPKAEMLVAVAVATAPVIAFRASMPAATVEPVVRVHTQRTLNRFQRMTAGCEQADMRRGAEKRWRAWCRGRTAV
ncbi:MAG TPA: hypothetical protein VN442_18470 [Bryobacteraceae bacterium]|nr:hypothetical protein [Bryobacteraceae bacterium]